MEIALVQSGKLSDFLAVTDVHTTIRPESVLSKVAPILFEVSKKVTDREAVYLVMQGQEATIFLLTYVLD